MAEIKVILGKDGIVRSAYVGYIEEKDVKASHDKIVKIASKIDRGKRKLLVDLTKATSATSRARKAFITAGRSGAVDRVAVVGLSLYIRILASFVIRAIGRGDIKVFENEEEALKWLREG